MTGRRLALVTGILAALAALLVSGCATPPASGSGWTSGRLSVRVQADDGRAAQSLAAAFELRGSGEQGELNLLSPLGSQLARARWAPGLAVLTTAADGERAFASLDELSVAALGERLPLAALPDWLAGRPWAGAASAAREAGFDQLGWSVDLSRRTEGRIDARREAPPVVTLRVQLERPASRGSVALPLSLIPTGDGRRKAAALGRS